MTPEEWAGELRLKILPHLYPTTEQFADIIRAAVAEERERCARIVEGKLPITGPHGMVDFKLLPMITKEIREG